MEGSVLLAQQELIEPAPTRRLVVPAGCEAWWGVDPGTLRVAVAHVAPWGARGARTASFAPLEGGGRLSAIYADTRHLVRSVLLGEPRWPWPGVVLVEQPSGKQPNPPLSYATGVIIAAVFDEVLEVTGHRVRVETTSSSAWKKKACGRGNIYKPKRGETHEYGVLTWARANGYTGSSYDEVDALGIAEAARRDIALEVRG